MQHERSVCDRMETRLRHARDRALQQAKNRLEVAEQGLTALDPRLVLQRGYAWLANEQGQAITGVAQVKAGQVVQASLADGQLNLSVLGIQHNPDKNS